MESQRPVRCSENVDLASYFWGKRQQMAETNGNSENLDLTLGNAYRNICSSKTPIKTLKDLSQIKGVGKWILRLMQGFFPKVSDASITHETAQKGKKAKRAKRYVPQKNSAAYALLITLYKETVNGSSFMTKQELIEAGEASGLSRTSIKPEKWKVQPGQFGSSPRDWYAGWSCMKSLITKGLIVKSSCPAKYMLTDEGKEAARECLLRSGLVDSAELLITADGPHDSSDVRNTSELDFAHTLLVNQDITLPHADNLQKDHVDTSDSDSAELLENDYGVTLAACTSTSMEGNNRTCSADASLRSFNLQACTSVDHNLHKSSNASDLDGSMDILAMPPRRYGEKFEDTYDVILILDDRENFGSRPKKIVDSIRSQFGVQVEVKRLPVGDGIWIARHRQFGDDYVLDFIVERKRVDDLGSSIRDNRYKDQKLRLQSCGLQKLIYLVEGDPNALEAAEAIKTACFTTEILEGFDVQRTSGLMDTVKKYGYLTQVINQYYITHFPKEKKQSTRDCPLYGQFVKKCQDLEKLTVSDVFALQLMQVPQVTEEIALAVLDLYPTLLSLAKAYALLEGNARAQEEMLKNQCDMIGGGASRNIFKLVWHS